MNKILITGALGQIGSELTVFLRKRYGKENVIASDVNQFQRNTFTQTEPFEHLDCLNGKAVHSCVKKYNIDTIFHLAAILSAKAENRPQLAWNVNIGGLSNVLEVAREFKCSVFTPSSIAAFGPSTPKENTPQETIQRPNTIYGISKVAGELLCDYYYKKYGVDTRGVRFPGIISHVTQPGGGTTDYAVDIFYHALKSHQYTCFLEKNTHLDMMYMPDALKASVSLMEADPARLKHRNAYNITAFSFCPRKLAEEISKHIPSFEMKYDIDPLRQAIADSWPKHLNDQVARKEWGWKPDHDLKSMVADMLEKLKIKLLVNV